MAIRQLANSGNDVPADITTIPIAKSDTLNFFAKLTEPLIIPSAPKENKINPIKRKKYSTI